MQKFCLISTIIAFVITLIYKITILGGFLTPETSPLVKIGLENNFQLDLLICFVATWVASYSFLYSKKIYTQILLAMLWGALFGAALGASFGKLLAPLGLIFINLLKMIIIPLVFASLIIGILSLGDVKKIGRIGAKTLLYFTITTIFAISIGLFLVNFIQPGKYLSQQDRQKYEELYKEKVQETSAKTKSLDAKELFISMVPTNPIKAMAEGNMLAIIFFAMFFGVALTTVHIEKRNITQKVLESVNESMIQMVLWIMQIAPIGVFCLMAETSSKTGLSFLRALLIYTLVVLTGFALQIIIVYGVLLRFFCHCGLLKFLRIVWPVEVMAFSTSSSSATLPFTLRCAEQDLKVPKEISSFVISLGATINMNGTALYLGVAAVFIAQVFNISLTFSQQLAILIVTTLSAIGTPGIPGGSIVFLGLILDMVGIPTLGIALVFGVDRILDMFRTTMNVMGDLTAAIYVNETEKNKLLSIQESTTNTN